MMESKDALIGFSALSQATRLDVFRLLIEQEPGGLAAGEIARRLAVPANTMSVHLATLARAGLITAERRSRSIVYRANVSASRALAGFLLDGCCGGWPERCDDLRAAGLSGPPLDFPTGRTTTMTGHIYSVLFLCTGNTARSILAESILRKTGGGRFNAFSAGSQPKGVINPLALKVLAHGDYPTDGLRSKNWNEFAGPDAPVMDFVFTVCDNAAGEACPVWPGQPMTAHWGIEDPAAVEGTAIEKERAFVQALKYLKNRISVFTALPIQSLDPLALGSKIREIGRLDGATAQSSKVA